MADSPLAEASADSLEVLFNRDPLNFSDEDRRRIILEFRRIRARLAASPTPQAASKAAPREKKKEISLSDLVGEA